MEDNTPGLHLLYWQLKYKYKYKYKYAGLMKYDNGGHGDTPGVHLLYWWQPQKLITQYHHVKKQPNGSLLIYWYVNKITSTLFSMNIKTCFGKFSFDFMMRYDLIQICYLQSDLGPLKLWKVRLDFLTFWQGQLLQLKIAKSDKTPIQTHSNPFKTLKTLQIWQDINFLHSISRMPLKTFRFLSFLNLKS